MGNEIDTGSVINYIESYLTNDGFSMDVNQYAYGNLGTFLAVVILDLIDRKNYFADVLYEILNRHENNYGYLVDMSNIPSGTITETIMADQVLTSLKELAGNTIKYNLKELNWTFRTSALIQIKSQDEEISKEDIIFLKDEIKNFENSFLEIDEHDVEIESLYQSSGIFQELESIVLCSELIQYDLDDDVKSLMKDIIEQNLPYVTGNDADAIQHFIMIDKVMGFELINKEELNVELVTFLEENKSSLDFVSLYQILRSIKHLGLEEPDFDKKYAEPFMNEGGSVNMEINDNDSDSLFLIYLYISLLNNY